MIDFIKVSLPPQYSEILLNHTDLDFYYQVNPKTSEIRSKNKAGKTCTPVQIAYHTGFKFEVYDSGRILVSGSIHKYWNNGAHNFNDFSLNDFRQCIGEFLETFKIKPLDAKLLITEVGLNISPMFSINSLLKNLFLHRGTPFLWVETQTEGKYKQCKHDRYRIKIYYKSMQYRTDYAIDREILRVEINFTGQQFRNLFAVDTLVDLINARFDDFNQYIINELNQILLYDWTIRHESERLLRYANQNYWLDYLDKNQKSAFNKHRRLLKDYTANYSDQIQRQLIQLFDTKFKELRGTPFTDLCIDGINTPPINKVCPITGYNIEMQRTDSNLLSHTGINYYRVHNYNSYLDLERRFLSNQWKTSSDAIKIKEIAHNIRNWYYNRKHRENPNQLSLFNV